MLCSAQGFKSITFVFIVRFHEPDCLISFPEKLVKRGLPEFVPNYFPNCMYLIDYVYFMKLGDRGKTSDIYELAVML